MGATAAHELEEFLRSKRSVERKGKRTVIQTSRGAAVRRVGDGEAAPQR
jgi:hypothetical protein